MIKGLENLMYEERLKKFLRGEEKAQGDLITILQYFKYFKYLKGGYREQRFFLHKEPCGEDKD